ncbi:unnamed protein product [Brachionus calyciflorus]|uniref:G-protein coupled receptors family 1 profile domain-containing protein n=1 Tax=Brachionus calyciflorus TaxID=104777 RepID=A0A814KIL2_9BILA|nr:unnamed protein product [Brachionus calyciflorus]
MDNDQVVECYKLQIISFYLMVLFLSSLFCNIILLYIIYKFNRFRTSLNIYILSLICLNLIGTLIELPITILSNFNCQWIFSQLGCVISGFLMYFIGCTSIYIMALISLERYFMIYNSLKTKLNSNQVLFSILICVILGFIWAFLPLVGWSHYSLEGALTSCSVEWNERNFNVLSYNVTIFITVFFIPILIIIITNFKLIKLIKDFRNVYKKFNFVYMRKKFNAERKATFSMILITVGFVISWIPYALVSLYRVFVDQKVSPLMGTIPAMFAKSTLLWTSLLYIYSNRQIRVLIKSFFVRRNAKRKLLLLKFYK